MRRLLELSIALAALGSSPALADGVACPDKVTPELLTSFGDPAAGLEPGQTLHRPAGLTIIGHPVSYVLVSRVGGSETGAVSELDYRLEGATRPYGERYPADLRKAFDKGFTGSNCGSGNSSCVIAFTGSSAGQIADAELSEGELSVPKEAHGDGLSLVKADLDLANADPVFLVCVYQPPK
jgi:hypothetical protein